MECEFCNEPADFVEEYCHRCVKIVCDDCLVDEWCPECLEVITENSTQNPQEPLSFKDGEVPFQEIDMFKVPEENRLTTGIMGSDKSYGRNGVFIIDRKVKRFQCIASDEEGWEHVSVTVYIGFIDRTPTWDEMCFIKDIFWSESDLVVQLHPPKSNYINKHEYVLHLWRRSGRNGFCEVPPEIMV